MRVHRLERSYEVGDVAGWLPEEEHGDVGQDVVIPALLLLLQPVQVHITAVGRLTMMRIVPLPRMVMRRRSQTKVKRRLKFSTPGSPNWPPRIFRCRTLRGWHCIAEMRLKPKVYEPPVYLIRHQNKTLRRRSQLSAVRAGGHVEENGHGQPERRACMGATQPRQLPL